MEESEDAEIEALVAAFVARRDSDAPESAEAFAARQPAPLRTGLLRALRALASAEELLPGATLDAPRRVGRFRVLAELGRGGMGRVFRAVDDRGQEVALKLMHHGLEGQPRAQERFRREAEALRRVRHAGVVRIVDAGLENERPYLAMELVAGESLTARLAGVRAGEAELPGSGPHAARAAALAAAIARALAAAHAAQVQHRDLNPRNVLLLPDGRPVLIDFGLVRVADRSTLTASGDLLGTPAYMAPEQARGEDTDERADVFALGALLLETLTLEPPRANATSLSALQAAGATGLPRLRGRLRGVPTPLARVVRHATAFRPAWRYAAASELADDLERFLAGADVQAPRTRLRETCALAWARHRAAALAAGLALALVAVLSWRIARGPSTELRAAAALDGAVSAWLDGDTARAAEQARLFAELVPDGPFAPVLTGLASGALPESSRDPAVAALLDGERARRGGDLHGAIERLQASWNVAPGRSVTLALLGRAELEARRTADALVSFERLARPCSTSRFVHATLATLYRELGFRDDAVRAATAASLLAPEDVDVLALLATVRLEAGDETGARSALSRALAVDPRRTNAAIEALAGDISERGDPATALVLLTLAREGVRGTGE